MPSRAFTLATALGSDGTLNAQDVSGLSTIATTGSFNDLINKPNIIVWQSVQTTGFTAVAGRAYPCNTTSAAFTVTLPASPTAGDLITLTDYAGTWDTNKLTVNPNGGKINGLTSNATLSTERGSINLVYVDTTQGWISYASNLSTSIVHPTPTVEYLVVAGGGGGRADCGGGGGAGGLLTGSTNVTANTQLWVTVGAGGSVTTNGNNSVFGATSSGATTGTIVAIGGGLGGAGSGGNSAGASGGSGGGGGNASGVGGAGTSGQGNAGSNAGGVFSGGAGGGAGAAGVIGPSTVIGGNGGAGSEWPSGSGTYYAGGGGGGGSSSGGSGGSGGGGPGGASGVNGTQGLANTGGGGGSGGASGASGAAGGSGVVIIRYADTYPAAASTTGSPTVTTSGGYRIYKWTGNGSITF